ncbi:DUF2851 family protein [Bacteroides propionicifaciens]|uniref:DUF2851 family protein n=1 Tax=Bacteroides propionicifaciens TaxID=392838 RepID=UPI000380EA8F|nr:DUF2851 family protein [Bacteroides propionicifaciens]
MEELLYYVWQYKLFTSSPLETTNHLPVEVIDSGLRNYSVGPTFLNAKLIIDHTLWVGNILVHGHHSGAPADLSTKSLLQDSVILEVYAQVESAKSDLCATDDAIPKLILSLPPELIDRYVRLRDTRYQPHCSKSLLLVDKLRLHLWFEALRVERLETKQTRLQELFESQNYLWEDIFFIALARNFGFGIRGDVFERWAKSLPYRALDKHKDSLFQVEAIFFGLAGLLQTDPSDRYMRELQDEFAFLSVKFNLNVADYPWIARQFKPGNYPHVRLAQLAWFYSCQRTQLSNLLDSTRIDDVYKALDFKTSPYWQTHVIFGKEIASRDKVLTRQAKDLLIINSVSPFLYAYAKHQNSQPKMELAIELLNQIKPENNYITRLWRAAHVGVDHAGDSQALIQLQKEYCDKNRCLACRIGYTVLTK